MLDCVKDQNVQFDIPVSDILSLAHMNIPVLCQAASTHSWNLVGVLNGNKYLYFMNGFSASPFVALPLRTATAGHQIVNVPVILGTDETSGNQSKKWNHHDIRN
ncbi:hypothetical protein HK096_004818, partial [Nowakowskiella sp. JEL0078]